MTKALTIGDLAKRTGTKVNTVRFYESIGLLPLPRRTSSGRRVYQEWDVRRLAFIRHGRALGFTTDQIRSLIQLSDQPDQDCAVAGAIAQRHVHDIETRIARLQVLRDELGKVASSCSGGRAEECRVIELIADWPEAPSAQGSTASSRRPTYPASTRCYVDGVR